jgi:RNA recognition motif-containing protein
MNIYVGNLHYDVDEEFLKTVFGEYGVVESAKIIIDKYSGKSKGFGFIEMTNEEESLKAIEALNGKEVKGRNLKVNQAREKSETNFKKTPKHKSYNR